MKHYEVSELDIFDGPVKIRLRRRGSEPIVAPVVAMPQPVAPAIVPGPAPSYAANPAPAAPTPSEAAPASKTIVIESPMVGTYYASGSPDAPPFVNVGAAVQPDSVVCIIEAMKVFTDIPAGVSGTIAEILVKNGQAVEFGQPLFRVVPS
jgi:acetyl-CoA carboxylase biotin carboxyl carrier protein